MRFLKIFADENWQTQSISTNLRWHVRTVAVGCMSGWVDLSNSTLSGHAHHREFHWRVPPEKRQELEAMRSTHITAQPIVYDRNLCRVRASVTADAMRGRLASVQFCLRAKKGDTYTLLGCSASRVTMLE